MLETAHHRLTLGGQFVVATNNPRDTWLQDEMQKLFAKVTRQPHEMGVLYRATKSAPLKKRKDYSCEFAFRDKERLLFLRTRPGVFSHRSLDGGARALIEVMQNSANQRVLDLGCGSGAVGLAAGFRAEGVQIAAIDSNPRAVESAEWAAGKNRLHSFQATLDADGSTIAPATFDVVLANPPYYSHFRLAELFLTIAARALRPTGRLWVVTKQPDWYLQRLPQIGFEVPNLRPSRTYWVVDATRSEPA
jgi:16S rRNA (guanine1207-N2)-methyltransferase